MHAHLVVTAAAHQQAPAITEAERAHFIVVAAQNAQFAPRCQLVQTQGAVRAGGSQLRAIGREGHALDRAFMSGQHP